MSVAGTKHGLDDVVELTLPAREETISEARHAVADFLSARGWSAAGIDLAVTEAVANAIEHGYRGRSGGKISVRLETLVPHTLVVTVADDGVGIEPDPESPGLGFGLALIGRMSRGFEVSRRDPGTEVRMVFDLTKSPM